MRCLDQKEPALPPPQRFRRRPDRPVAAVRLPPDCDGLRYRKWGAEQHGKPGDWLVDNEGDVYTVDAASFERTYRAVGTGAYVKTAPVWASRAEAAGSVPTREGTTHYAAGDYLVSNREDGSDAYAIAAGKFETLYEPDR
jgi:hypothetical protein